MASVRERLAALAAPLGITLPEEYVTFVENPPAAGILIRHLRADGDPPTEWWPETIDGLEADIHGGRGKKVVSFAHYVRETAAEYLSGGHQSVHGPEGTKFGADRLSRGFWIGEEDGDSVFLDPEMLGVFAYLEHDGRVERWASSFAAFVAHGQQPG